MVAVSNGSRTRVWKAEWQGLADALGRRMVVSHLPPGTSTWNSIEQRLLAYSTQHWRGKPWVRHGHHHKFSCRYSIIADTL